MVDYDEKIKQSTTNKAILGLGWSIDELSHLNDIGRSLLIELQQVLDILSDPSADLVSLNVAAKLQSISEMSSMYLKGKR